MAFDEVLGSLGELGGAWYGDHITAEDRKRILASLAAERGLYGGVSADSEDFVELGPSAYENLLNDPGRAAQGEALARLQEIARANGLDPQARSLLMQAQLAGATQERAQRGAILDTFSRRGAGGSGNALVASLTAQQGAAQRAGLQGAQIAGDGAARAYRALSDAGTLGGQMYQQSADRASALDRVSAYNASNRQAVQARNVAAQNAARQRRIELEGGMYGADRANIEAEMRRKRALATGTGKAVGTATGAALDTYFSGGMDGGFGGGRNGGVGGFGGGF